MENTQRKTKELTARAAASRVYRLAVRVKEIYSELYALQHETELKPFLEIVEDCTRKLVETESDLSQIGNNIY